MSLRVRFIHRCEFCGFERPSPSEVLMPPRCGDCGCLLTAQRPLPALPAEPAAPTLGATGAITALVVLGLLVAAVRAGYELAGWSTALVSIGLCGLLLAPLAGPSPRR